MLTFLARRVLHSLLSLAILLVVVFFVSRVSGDPVDLYLPESASQQARDELRAYWGLDRPVTEQFMAFVGGVARLDLGRSWVRGEPALGLVAQRLPFTVVLATVTTALALGLGLVLGSLAAARSGKAFDRATRSLAFATIGIPEFWLGLVLILVFAVFLGWFPTSGSGGVEYAVLPIATLLLRPLGALTLIVRSSVGEQLAAPYIATAFAKGLSSSRVLFRHALPNALIPTLTVAGDIFVHMLNGVVIVEVVFGWPGIGKLTIDAIANRDFAIIHAAVLVVACMVFVVNLAIDIGYAALDPRIRLA